MTSNETSAFNLIELMIVIVILAIAISVAVVKYADYSRRVEIASAYSSAKALEAAIIRKISIKDSPLSNTDKASFNLNSVAQKNIKYFASINVVDAANIPPDPALPDTVLAEINKSVPTSNIIAYAQYNLQPTCSLIANKPAKWFNIFYYLSSNDSTKQQISSTLIGVGAKLDCMPSTYQKTLCPDTSYSKGGACVACTPLSGAIKPCTGTSDATCVSGATQIGNYCKCNTGTYWDGSKCSSCSPLTGPAGTVQACSDTSDATCIGGTTQTGSTCSCGTNQYWNGSACSTCTSTAVASCNSSTGGATSCNSGYHLSGTSGTAGTTCISCGANQYWNGSACSTCTSTAVASCNSSTGGATSCNSGYHLSGTSGAAGTTCISCGANQYWNGSACSTCTSTAVASCNSSTGGATSCNSGYHLSGTSGAAGTTCISCGANQYWNGSACTTCTALTGPSGTVQACTSTTDTRCVDGTIRSGNTCASCPANATCNNNNINCNSGYTLSGNVCIAACSANCISCTSPTKCTTCQTGYYIKNGACSACPSYATCTDGISFVCYPIGFTRGTDSCTCAAGANIILPGHTGGWSQVSQPMCALCLSGTMSSSVNSMSCTTCPANTFAPGPTMQDMGGYYISTSGGSTECTPCPSGTHSMPGAAICY